jgi:predicted dehydrogenase
MASSIPSTSPKLNIAIIGAGLIGPRHAHSILTNPQTTLHSITDPAPHSPELAASLRTTHYASVSALLSSPPDAAIVCTPNHTHVPLSLRLLSAGIPVLVEKPISTRLRRAWL